ncbi:hypothetical protein MKEN_00606900 [Mycena kentingensis (nom. inval.)]|nr:hypothetical protein MKEN_00606900 [Mycena kentingensis (nom. inval.)]
MDVPAKRVLPSKESSLFKELLNLYEGRLLKKGLKTADQILKKFPEHGETMCMKGLILTHMGKREEGVDLVKKGVRNDLTSHIVWHVYGLIHKGERNYEEALKCYTQALRFDKENLNILRDAAHLQTQIRNYDGLVESRHALLRIRPNVRQHWVALAVAYHLNGNLAEAKNVLEKYEPTLKNIPDYDVEHSETMLYHVRLLEDLGQHTEALSMLDVNAKSRRIVDRTAIMEIRARLLSKLRADEAEHAWRVLVEHNSDCYEYYRGYLANMKLSLDDTSPARALAVLEEFSTQLPRATAPRRLSLTISSGEQFASLAKPYILAGLEKGIPSLFSDIKSLYQDVAKQKAIEDVATEALETFKATSVAGEPTSYLWTLYFLAQHHSYLGRHPEALAVLAQAIEHTPTLPELHMFKGRVLKRAGDLLGGARCLEEARLLDGQDRFLNTKCAKYRLRAGMIDDASTIFGMFTKKDAPSPGQDLTDMQSLFYLTEAADAYCRNGELGPALKKYMAVARVFEEVEDDQYDFHGYALRKFTINNYLKWVDLARVSRPMAERLQFAILGRPLAGASGVRQIRVGGDQGESRNFQSRPETEDYLQIFVSVHDEPSIASSGVPSGALTDAQKKAKKKAKKAAQKAQEEAKKSPAPQPNNNEDKGLEPPVKDDDPDGSKLLQCTDPLERAAKLLKPLTTQAESNVDVWVATYDVASRRKKYLQAGKALVAAAALDPEHPELHIRRVEFKKIVASLILETPASPLISELATKLLPEEVSLETFNSQYLQRHATEPAAVLAAAKVLAILDAPREQVEETVFSALGPTLTVKTALTMVEFLETLKSSRKEEFRTTADGLFPLSTVFKPVSELDGLKGLVSVDAKAADDDKLEQM